MQLSQWDMKKASLNTLKRFGFEVDIRECDLKEDFTKGEEKHPINEGKEDWDSNIKNAYEENIKHEEQGLGNEIKSLEKSGANNQKTTENEIAYIKKERIRD